MFRRQKQVVTRLSALAANRAEERARLRRGMRRWRQTTFGRLDTLTWSFAIGAWWAAGKNAPTRRSRLRRAAVGTTNALWLAWRLLNRPVALGERTDDERSANQR